MTFPTFARTGLFCFIATAVNCATPKPPPQRPHDTYEPVRPLDRDISYPAATCAAERPADPNGVVLGVPHINQQTRYTEKYESNLCWAASISMVSTFLGNPRETCQIASYVAKDGLSCCRLARTSPVAERDACNVGAHLGPVLKDVGLYHLRNDGPIPEELLRRDIANGRPVIVQTSRETEENGKKVRTAHAMVVVGYYSWGVYRVNNPNRAEPYELTYAELVSGKKDWPWTWDVSWYHLSYRKDGCNPRYSAACDCK